ncbi:hypothetical protein NK553_18495 [Pseudomonas sp. ZM23]|uniref:Lysozyme n=1 Tax=Pseudomonas triclosanedens TaxID=2961893 RepID=A0ABY6ZTV7_9PSED|nr:hypothetical protein [Pseudomonas triclosanedens]MCP8465945.1 hypothetical protein [Pseudomonas triclosanedens]MCP8472266.1 hypothetical protein [Pseudomonas triclosanedens]MCP8477244.1 hypothetical protein [Pseudomonas triclosanedens]WAI47418.1 hypothetical protein OU419_16720 [Pseudomonas triclosanedens]
MTGRWKLIALVLAILLLLAAGAGLGGWLAAGHYRPQLDAASDARTQCLAARNNLEALVGDQNAAIAQLANQAEQRQAKAAQAVAAAQQQADRHYAAAQRLQQERVGGDQCAAAEAIIDQELGL